MVAEVFGGIGAFKAALDILKTVKDANDVATRQGIVIKLQEQILSAQEAQFALIEQVGTLKQDIARFETWDAEKQRYELKTVARGAFAYTLKKDADSSEPAHWLCANCYQHRKKSLLQYQSHGSPGPDYTKSIWSCSTCKAQIKVPFSVQPGQEDETNG